MRFNTRFAGVLLALSVLMSGCGSDEGSPPVLTDVIWPLTLPVQYQFNFTDLNFPDRKGPALGRGGLRRPGRRCGALERHLAGLRA